MSSSPSQSVPAGYERIAIECGFNDGFGPLYSDRAGSQLAFRVDQQHLNPVSGLHGGALAAFVDAQVALFYPAGSDIHCPTISLNVDYVSPAKFGDWVEADVTLLKVTRSLAFSQCLVRVGTTPIARVSAIYSNRGIPVSE